MLNSPDDGRTGTAELVRTAARSVIAEHDAGRHVDPDRLAWAIEVLRNNPRPESEVVL